MGLGQAFSGTIEKMNAQVVLVVSYYRLSPAFRPKNRQQFPKGLMQGLPVLSFLVSMVISTSTGCGR